MPYVGSRISLISMSEIRYEGILYVINTEESTIALQNVRSYGTEGRTKPDVPPTDEVYDFIIFRGEDIKDLTVLEGTSAKQQSQRAVLQDPAVVSVGPERKVAQQQHKAPSGARESSNREHRGNTADRYDNSRGYEKKWEDRRGAPQQRNGSSYQSQTRDYRNSGYVGGKGKGKGGHYRPSNGHHRSSHGGPIGELKANENAQTKAEIGTEEFDFSSANEKFEKAPQIEESARSGYAKSKGFFDDISCDALDRAAGKEGGFDRAARDKQRELDRETFGASANMRPFGGHRRFHRGGAKGGKSY